MKPFGDMPLLRPWGLQRQNTDDSSKFGHGTQTEPHSVAPVHWQWSSAKAWKVVGLASAGPSWGTASSRDLGGGEKALQEAEPSALTWTLCFDLDSEGNKINALCLHSLFLSPCPCFLQLGHKCFRNIMGRVWEMGMKAGTKADLPSTYFLANEIFFSLLQMALPLILSMTRVQSFARKDK